MDIREESPNKPDVLQLIDALDAYQKPLYPAESHHGIDLVALMKSNVVFVVARDHSGTAIGCGAMVVGAHYAEIKRMFVAPQGRGQGIGRQILALLEVRAKARGCIRFKLETGPLQPEALALYEGCGYVRCGPFGDYIEDPNSVFMFKDEA